MPVNKNAHIRYNALDQCFSNQYKKFFIEDLMTYCSDSLSDFYGYEKTISRRQIYDDIKFMKSESGFSAPIESYQDSSRVYYRYSDLDFSILKKPLLASELELIQESLETLSRMKNIPGFDWINNLQAKMKFSLDQQAGNKQIIGFQENEYLKGLEFLNPLYQYILNKQAVNLDYFPFGKTPLQDILISPQFLKQSNDRWFLFGWNHKGKFLQTFALDRINAITQSKAGFVISEVDFNEYFDDIIGVTNPMNKHVEKIEIQLSDNIIPYIETKPVHGSQIIKGNILQLSAKHNYELESLILAFGENMKVLSPATLANSIKQRIQQMNDNY